MRITHDFSDDKDKNNKNKDFGYKIPGEKVDQSNRLSPEEIKKASNRGVVYPEDKGKNN